MSAPQSPTTALVLNYHDPGMDSAAANLTIRVDVLYSGIGVPGGFWLNTVPVTFSFPATAVGIASSYNASVTAAIRADAVSRGFTIPASGVLGLQWVSE